MRTSTRLLAAASAAALGAALWWRRHPSACPYSQRFWLSPPHPLITRSRLVEALEPRPGERILEVGPGTGYYTLDIAGRIAPGTLDMFDIQQEMLDHTMRRAAEAGLANLIATQGNAEELPYDDGAFDAAFLVTVLGEIPDQHAALRELARVIRPGGRLVVGELFADPHRVSPGALRERGAAAGLRVTDRFGPSLGCFIRLERPAEVS
jgi:ubiquinone/menaquinone biosynthesis C-methylase UbiE